MTLLAERRRSPAVLLGSVLLHAALAAALFCLQFPQARRALPYNVATLYLPEQPRRVPEAVPAPPPRRAWLPPRSVPAPSQAVQPIVAEPLPRPLAALPEKMPEKMPEAVPRVKPPEVPTAPPAKTGVFAAAQPANTTAEPRPAPEVRSFPQPALHAPKTPIAVLQTGVFGGLAAMAESHADSRLEISEAGFGSARRNNRTVVGGPAGTAGFASAGAGAPPAAASAIHSAAARFEAVAAPALERREAARPSAPASTALMILEKPAPVYSDEARRLQMEGEVVLEVLFGAAGEIRVLRVVRGLGHGLDESAAAAAAAIRYRPATRGGKPVDVAAMVRIAFQLAW